MFLFHIVCFSSIGGKQARSQSKEFRSHSKIIYQHYKSVTHIQIHFVWYWLGTQSLHFWPNEGRILKLQGIHIRTVYLIRLKKINHFSDRIRVDSVLLVSGHFVSAAVDLRKKRTENERNWICGAQKKKPNTTLTHFGCFGFLNICLHLKAIHPFGQCYPFIIIYITISWHFFATFFQNTATKLIYLK